MVVDSKQLISDIVLDTDNKMHKQCKFCGKLLHIKCSSLDNVSSHIENEHGFKIDLSQTIIYGYCAECSKGVNS